MNTLTREWRDTLRKILNIGVEVSPRGKKTLEIPQHTVEVDMNYPVLMDEGRKLHYGFMAAEAYWILTGDNTVAGIAPYNSHIGAFSDDGVVFAGAYGPRISKQIDYVVGKLAEDQNTRQAVMTIWTPNPGPSKDIPCTVALDFKIRNGALNVHVYMRSSDAWLGLPYDVFNFSMLGALVCGILNDYEGTRGLRLGTLFLTAGSSHLYETNFEAAEECLQGNNIIRFVVEPSIPDNLRLYPATLMSTLQELRHSKKGHHLRWWEGNDAPQP